MHTIPHQANWPSPVAVYCLSLCALHVRPLCMSFALSSSTIDNPVFRSWAPAPWLPCSSQRQCKYHSCPQDDPNRQTEAGKQQIHAPFACLCPQHGTNFAAGYQKGQMKCPYIFAENCNWHMCTMCRIFRAVFAIEMFDWKRFYCQYLCCGMAWRDERPIGQRETKKVQRKSSTGKTRYGHGTQHRCSRNNLSNIGSRNRVHLLHTIVHHLMLDVLLAVQCTHWWSVHESWAWGTKVTEERVQPNHLLIVVHWTELKRFSGSLYTPHRATPISSSTSLILFHLFLVSIHSISSLVLW